MLSLSFGKVDRHKATIDNTVENPIHKRRAGSAQMIAYVLVAILSAFAVNSVYDLYKRAEINNTVSEFANQMTELPATISSIFATQRNFTGLTATVLLDSGAIPDKWQNADGDGILHIGGDAITVAAAGTSRAAFVLRFTNLPQAMCRKAVTDGLGASGFQTGNTATGTISASTIGPVAAASLCSSELNSLTATYVK